MAFWFFRTFILSYNRTIRKGVKKIKEFDVRNKENFENNYNLIHEMKVFAAIQHNPTIISDFEYKTILKLIDTISRLTNSLIRKMLKDNCCSKNKNWDI